MKESASIRSASSSTLGRVATFITLGILTATSISLQGFSFGVVNNAFHIPLVLRWAELPAFSDEPYYQTLSRFVSGLWWLLGFIANEENIREVFLVAHIVSRFTAVAAMFRLLGHLGLHGSMRWACLALLALAPVLYGYSRPGDHGLFIDYFTHTEATWAPVLMALLAGARCRWKEAGAWAGLSAVLNLFVASWIVAILGVTVLWMDRHHPRRAARSVLQLATVFAVVALPILGWTVWAVMTAPPTAFSFREYIRFYYPAHFLIEDASPAGIVESAAVWLSAVLLSHRRGWSAWLVMLVVMAGILAVGVVLPYVIDERILFNLHLLRIDGVIRFVSIILVASASLGMLASPRHVLERTSAVTYLLAIVANSFVPALVFLLAAMLQPTSRRTVVGLGGCAALLLVAAARPDTLAEWGGLAVWAFGGAAFLAGRDNIAVPAWRSFGLFAATIAALMLLMHFRLGIGGATLAALVLATALALIPEHESVGRVSFSRLTTTGCVSLVLMLGVVAAGARVRNAPPVAAVSRQERDWMDMAAWVRRHPSPAPVLIPVRHEDEVSHYNFSLWAKTPVWVDWKQGAAVMWSPVFYETWRSRLENVSELRTVDAFAAYAHANGIPRYLSPKPSSYGACQEPYELERLNDTYLLCRHRNSVGLP